MLTSPSRVDYDPLLEYSIGGARKSEQTYQTPHEVRHHMVISIVYNAQASGNEECVLVLNLKRLGKQQIQIQSFRTD